MDIIYQAGDGYRVTRIAQVGHIHCKGHHATWLCYNCRVGSFDHFDLWIKRGNGYRGIIRVVNRCTVIVGARSGDNIRLAITGIPFHQGSELAGVGLSRLQGERHCTCALTVQVAVDIIHQAGDGYRIAGVAQVGYFDGEGNLTTRLR